MNSFTDCVGARADAQQSEHLGWNLGKSPGRNHDQEEAQGDDKSKDQQLEAGHAGAAADFTEDSAQIDGAFENVDKDRKPPEQEQEQQAIANGQFQIVLSVAALEKQPHHDCDYYRQTNDLEIIWGPIRIVCCCLGH